LFARVSRQSLIILSIRFFLILFLFFFWFFQLTSLKNFIVIYSLILFLGVVFELNYFRRHYGLRFALFSPRLIPEILKTFGWHHVDFLAFNLFPLILIIVSGWFLDKSQIGRVNFSIQLINLIFLFAIVGNIRISSYVSSIGFRGKILRIKKLFLATLAISFASSFFIWGSLHFASNLGVLKSFTGVSSLFFITIFSIPGYLLYQFLNPIIIEMGKIREAALLNVLNFSLFFILSFFVLPVWKELGAALLFLFFHLGLFIIQVRFAFKFFPRVLAE